MKKVSLRLKTIDFLSQNYGFTLFEVMIALVVFGFSIVFLLQVQSRSVVMAVETRNIIIATGLAKSKLLDCKIDLLKDGFSFSDYSKEGNFASEGFPNFRWQCHSYNFNVPVSNVDLITKEDKFKKSQGSAYNLSFGLKIISKIMNNSVKELVAIVSWGDSESYDKIELITHIADKNAIAHLGIF